MANSVDPDQIELRFKATSTFLGHFVSSPREREKRDRFSRDERLGQGRKRKRNESKETEEIKNIPPFTLSCPAVSQFQLDAPMT